LKGDKKGKERGEKGSKSRSGRKMASVENLAMASAVTESSVAIKEIDLDGTGKTSGGELAVKGGLRRCLKFWEEICPLNSWRLSVVSHGYRIPFLSGAQVPTHWLPNSKKALDNSSFVGDHVGLLLADMAVRKVGHRPRVTSPLSVADNGVKLRLILDLSWLEPVLSCPPFLPPLS
jgi:hypothetical protein